jgi:trans-aconitate methyltransferase
MSFAMTTDVSVHRAVPLTDGNARAWAEAWQASWDAQQMGFMVDREERFAALLDLVEVAAGPAPTVIDLACGTASITRRLLARLPEARAVAVDVDPVLLTIARGSLGSDERVRIVRADLRDPAWKERLSGVQADAVVTSTALHWLPEDDLARVYRDLHDLVRPGGLVGNADTMPADGLPQLGSGLRALAERREEAALARGVESWRAWWERAAADPVLEGPMAERATLFGGADHPPSFVPPAGWHVAALGAAGFTEAGVAWRSGTDAIVAALR